MTIALSYLDDLSRVRIALSDRADGTVLVERSATSGFELSSGNDLAVRGGVELPISGGVGQLDDYEFYADVENWYRITPVDPPAGLSLDGVAGNYASTPDTAALDITGDIDLRVEASTDWTSPGGVARVLVAKYLTTGNQRAYRLNLISNGILQLQWSTNGTAFTTVPATVAVPAINGRQAVRATLDVDNGSSQHVVRFYTAPTIDDTFELLQEITNSGTTSIFASSAALTVGASNDGANDRFTGTIHHAQVRNGIAGTVVANPRFNVQDHGDTSFVDGVGLTWTVNGTAAIMGVETDSITPSLDGQVWLKSIKYPLQNWAVEVADYGDVEQAARSAAFFVEGRALPTGVGELHGGRDHVLVLGTETQADEDHLSLAVRTGDVFYIHVPTVADPDCEGNTLLPGSMYVLVGRPRKHRIGGVSRFHNFELPLTEVNAPGPDVVGTTLTLGGLLALHGSIESVWAAYPTIRDLWSTIGSLEDLITI